MSPRALQLIIIIIIRYRREHAEPFSFLSIRVRALANASEVEMCNWTLASLSLAPVCQTYTYLSFERNYYFQRHNFLLFLLLFHLLIGSIGMKHDAIHQTVSCLMRTETEIRQITITSISNYRNHLFIRYWIYVPFFRGRRCFISPPLSPLSSSRSLVLVLCSIRFDSIRMWLLLWYEI